MVPPNGGAAARLEAILEDHGIARAHSGPAREEAERWMADPRIDDPTLVDLTALPFLTIDNPGSRDLDQALHIERTAQAGYRVRYALADASFFVRPGSALYAEANRRGVTYYLPGLAAPMLPRALSEGIVSLNPDVDRRALVLDMTLDERARRVQTSFVRARIRSRGQLTYDGVQAFYDAGAEHPWANAPFASTLALLREVGARRIALAEARNVVRYHRTEIVADIDPADPDRFVVRARRRNDVERYNEEISLLCNAEGARFMAEPGRAPHVTPIFRVHPEPTHARQERFRKLTVAVAEVHRLDANTWRWREALPLADFIAQLPEDGPHARISAALNRQAIMINRRSEFSVEPGRHHGVGVEPYARFSSPMREMVGIFTHKEALEKLTGDAPTGWPAAARREQEAMVALANRTRALQNRVSKAADLLVLAQFLDDDLARPSASRPVRSGTVLGIVSSKIYVQLDDPPLALKVRIADLAEAHGAPLTADRAGVAVRDGADAVYLRLGDEVKLRLAGRRGRRYVFERADESSV